MFGLCNWDKNWSMIWSCERIVMLRGTLFASEARMATARTWTQGSRRWDNNYTPAGHVVDSYIHVACMARSGANCRDSVESHGPIDKVPRRRLRPGSSSSPLDRCLPTRRPSHRCVYYILKVNRKILIMMTLVSAISAALVPSSKTLYNIWSF